jgi:hypothetical protein
MSVMQSFDMAIQKVNMENEKIRGMSVQPVLNDVRTKYSQAMSEFAMKCQRTM